MKRIGITFLMALCFVTAGLAQMSDSQVLNYAKQEYTKGTSQVQIASDMMKRGVTREQLERVQRAAGAAGAERGRTVADNDVELLMTSILDVRLEGRQVFGRNIFD